MLNKIFSISLNRPPFDGLDSRGRKVIHNRNRPDYRYSFTVVDRDGWTRERSAYLEEPRCHFRSGEWDFLIIDIPAGEGWEKLCPFLEVPIPATPFPFRNRFAPAAQSGARPALQQKRAPAARR